MEYLIKSKKPKVRLSYFSKEGNNISYMCDFEDLIEDELSVVVPKKSFEEESLISGTIFFEYNGKMDELQIKGKVVDIEDFDGKDTLLIILSDTPDNLNDFLKSYELMQEEVHDLMERMKGY